MGEPPTNQRRTRGGAEAAALLPTSRIRTIMKSSLDTGQISNEVLFLMSRSTEMFVKCIANEAFSRVAGAENTLKYLHLSSYVHDEDRLEFLLQIVPKKIKVKDFKGIIERDDDSLNSSSESDND